MSPSEETLFSLELVIDYVRFDGSRGDVLDPAVAVRFLDFPTLLIHRSKQEDLPSESGYANLCLSPEAKSQADDGERLKYSFHKGKSCLFKISLHSLHAHLTNTPLYAMVLDVKDEIPKLIGSSLISLAKATEEIKSDVEKRGIGNPSARGERLAAALCDLMGRSMGVISLAYKIVSLGANLLPHIPESRVREVGVTRGKAELDSTVRPEKDDRPGSVLLGQISLDGQSAGVVISEAKRPGVPAFTQTETTGAKQRVSWSEDAEENTTFCPPPLVYCSSAKNPQESFTGLLAAMENLNIEDPEDGSNEVEPSDAHFAEMTAMKADGSMTLTSAPHKETGSAAFGHVIRQLPLLNALLVELSQLNVQAAQEPLTVHPNLAWLYASAQEPPGAERRTRPDRREKKASNKDKSRPKKTLKCGLTNTFRLRLKLAKPGTKRHECIGRQDAKQNRPPSSDHKRLRRAAGRGVHLEETVDTSRFDVHRPQTHRKRQRDQVSERTSQTRRPKFAFQVLIRTGIRPFTIRTLSSREETARGPSSSSGEYQDDFTSLNTTEGCSPDPFSSPEPSGRRRSSPSSSHSSRGLPKAETSPRVIRPHLQTSALSLSSDESGRRRPGSQRAGQKSPSARGTFGKSEGFDGDPVDKAAPFSRVSEDSDSAASNPLKPVSSSEQTDEQQDELGSLGRDENCRHISELVINKLPGYTL
ncbi:LOW QUALITY PROTEIN: microtubule-associated protein 10 [Puntigrus tetrazona]|uniref:LOW QUALITY PROTEIN: microtubule-associated protein 10 n=1 Tax=Puntigrus tetrazona TaxID=1606681 RepID=UPI001C89B6B0|nr:LOW QUALITY PROTEIN: microtubule-associated protein 10 [Puntigrus tetrazona]